MHVDCEVSSESLNVFLIIYFFRIRNINCDGEGNFETAESLHFKLSLKKQIWTGTQSDTTLLDFSRPLSYGAQSSAAMMFNKSIFYDSEALLT